MLSKQGLATADTHLSPMQRMWEASVWPPCQAWQQAAGLARRTPPPAHPGTFGAAEAFLAWELDEGRVEQCHAQPQKWLQA